MIIKWMPKVIINCIKINLWAPMGLIFRIWAGFVRVQFLHDFLLAKSWSQKSKKSEKLVRGGDRVQTEPAEPRPRRNPP